VEVEAFGLDGGERAVEAAGDFAVGAGAEKFEFLRGLVGL
jgi:hypothetical protein